MKETQIKGPMCLIDVSIVMAQPVFQCRTKQSSPRKRCASDVVYQLSILLIVCTCYA